MDSRNELQSKDPKANNLSKVVQVNTTDMTNPKKVETSSNFDTIMLMSQNVPNTSS